MFTYTKTWLKSFFKNDEGVTAIECGVVAFVFGIALVGSFTLVG